MNTTWNTCYYTACITIIHCETSTATTHGQINITAATIFADTSSVATNITGTTTANTGTTTATAANTTTGSICTKVLLMLLLI